MEFKNAVSFFQSKLPAAGYKLLEGDAEMDEAESTFSGQGFQGKWKVNGILNLSGSRDTHDCRVEALVSTPSILATLRQGIQLRLHLPPVVVLLLVTYEFLDLRQLHALWLISEVSLSGHRVAATRWRRSTSAASATLMRKGRTNCTIKLNEAQFSFVFGRCAQLRGKRDDAGGLASAAGTVWP